MALLRARALTLFVWAVSCTAAYAQAPVAYRLSFPEREHHLMQVEITFPDVPTGPLQVHMSRSSPGRDSMHEFAKSVFDVRVTDQGGTPLTVTRPGPDQWEITGHSG